MQNRMKKFFENTDYIRVGGTIEELNCANYIKDEINKLGIDAHLESFKVQMANIKEVQLLANNKEIKAKAYRCSKDCDLTAPLYYLKSKSDLNLSKVKGKIVLMIGYFGKWMYQDLVDNGALAYITTTGIQSDSHEDIDDRELRAMVKEGKDILPGVNINIKDAIKLIEEDVEEVSIKITQEQYESDSHNVVCDIKGNNEEMIVFTAHYDSVPLSNGVYDNMSGSVGIFELLNKFKDTKPNYSLRFIWCGSEERGLLGSRAYCEANELDKIRLVINLDMIGCILGNTQGCVTGDISLVHYLDIFAKEMGFSLHAYQGVYSSDSTPFADKGIPAISFARIDPHDMDLIHNRYDKFDLMSLRNMQEDIEFVYSFASRMANAKFFPVKKEMPENMKEELDYYNLRKKKEK